uniref:G_PROTEIN_RECEP_F1_2 domain-containing protein n=1 Tax=Ascaris lumbricoides TaxID=6252 RepID=A0A0M3I3H8_ASCLU
MDDLESVESGGDVLPTSGNIDLLPLLPYILEGPPLIAFNLFLLWYLLLGNETRGQRPYQILAGCAAFDVVFCSAYLATGIYRLQLLNSYDRMFNMIRVTSSSNFSSRERCIDKLLPIAIPIQNLLLALY